MLLQHIVELFDAELDRLQRLRSIVSGLARPSVVPSAEALDLVISDVTPAPAGVESLPEGVAAASTPPAKPKRTPRQRSAAAEPRPARAVKRAEEPSALRGPIPQGPVVVSASQLQTRPAKLKPAPAPQSSAEPERGSLGSMIRALRLETTS